MPNDKRQTGPVGSTLIFPTDMYRAAAKNAMRGTEEDFTVPQNPFAFTPHELSELLARNSRSKNYIQSSSGLKQQSKSLDSIHVARQANTGCSTDGGSEDEILQQYKRDTHGVLGLLWDPNTDNPNTGKAFQRDRNQSLAKTPSRRLNPSKNYGSKPEKSSLLQGKRKSQPLKTRQEQSMSNEPRTPNLEEPQKSASEGLEAEPELLLQPDTRPISHEQLVVEVKEIYAGLVIIEAKCIDLDERQSAATRENDPTKRTNLKNNQWQSLIALHKQLLHEHHDFFLTSQHPSASPALNRLAAKYSIPARMWRHGIHGFLEILRHRLPESLEHMLAFIYIAYSMMALLYESVSTFEDTWIECLGDLGRYRMAIEDDEPKDRKVWSNVARFWYLKAADKSPNVGRLYHHLAILARPYTLEQLSLYHRSLTCDSLFESAKGSILTLFNPILSGKDDVQYRLSSFEATFVKAQGLPNAKHPLPEDFIMRDQLYSQWDFPDNWFTAEKTDDDEQLCDPLSMAWARMERMLRLGHQTALVRVSLPVWKAWLTYIQMSWYIYQIFSRVRESAALVKGLKRKRLYPSPSTLLPFMSSFLPLVSGSPIGNSDTADQPSSMVFSVPLLPGSLYAGFSLAFLAGARSLAAKLGPIRVWGCLMAISAYGWWVVRNDTTASPSLSIA